MATMKSTLITLLMKLFLFCSTYSTKPNIIFILMDDMGWNDVEFNGGQIPTKNINDLYLNSISLTKHYIHMMCSPSRTQIITGRYSMYQGFSKMRPWDYEEIGGIPIGQPTVANWLKTMAGYTTYAVGKWHLGYATEELIPTHRGFDRFFGFYQGAIHYDTMKYVDLIFGDIDHFDFWEDETESIYETDDNSQINTMHLYKDKILEYIGNTQNDKNPFYMYLPLQSMHDPLNIVHDKVDECIEILGDDGLPLRQIYCQNILLVDDIMGDIINEVKKQQIWDNTLIIFTSDNGANLDLKGCNYPLRGTKGTYFDGNIHTFALIGGGIIPLQQRGTQNDVLFSSLDWTPTLLHFADILNDIKINDRTWDGIDQYTVIMDDETGTNKIRDHIVLNIGLRSLESASIIFEYNHILYKYIAQNDDIDVWSYKRIDGWCINDEYGNWGLIEYGGIDTELSQINGNKYLFDLTNDVSEKTNLLNLYNEDTNFKDIIDYAIDIMIPYTQHPLYSEYLEFLWWRLPSGDPSLQGQQQFIKPFLSQNQYYQQLHDGFNFVLDEYEKDDLPVPFTNHLKNLYFTKWTPPKYSSINSVVYKSTFNNYLSYIIIVIIMMVFMIIICSVIHKYFKKTIYDHYKPIINHDKDDYIDNIDIKPTDINTALIVGN